MRDEPSGATAAMIVSRASRRRVLGEIGSPIEIRRPASRPRPGVPSRPRNSTDADRRRQGPSAESSVAILAAFRHLQRDEPARSWPGPRSRPSRLKRRRCDRSGGRFDDSRDRSRGPRAGASPSQLALARSPPPGWKASATTEPPWPSKPRGAASGAVEVEEVGCGRRRPTAASRRPSGCQATASRPRAPSIPPARWPSSTGRTWTAPSEFGLATATRRPEGSKRIAFGTVIGASRARLSAGRQVVEDDRAVAPAGGERVPVGVEVEGVVVHAVGAASGSADSSPGRATTSSEPPPPRASRRG